ncbi:MAG: RND transporter, partial [Rubrivivax sp.]|nr:RND transporter [Rubrivivax sp.]
MRIAPWLATAALLSGCAAGVPTPPLPGVAPAWQAAVPAAPPTEAGAIDPLGRNHPLLQELIASAQRASPTLAVAAERLEAARAAATSAGAALQPLAEATGSTQLTRPDPGA